MQKSMFSIELDVLKKNVTLVNTQLRSPDNRSPVAHPETAWVLTSQAITSRSPEFVSHAKHILGSWRDSMIYKQRRRYDSQRQATADLALHLVRRVRAREVELTGF